MKHTKSNDHDRNECIKRIKHAERCLSIAEAHLAQFENAQHVLQQTSHSLRILRKAYSSQQSVTTIRALRKIYIALASHAQEILQAYNDTRALRTAYNISMMRALPPLEPLKKL